MDLGTRIWHPEDFAGADDIIANLEKERKPVHLTVLPNLCLLLVLIQCHREYSQSES